MLIITRLWVSGRKDYHMLNKIYMCILSGLLPHQRTEACLYAKDHDIWVSRYFMCFLPTPFHRGMLWYNQMVNHRGEECSAHSWLIVGCTDGQSHTVWACLLQWIMQGPLSEKRDSRLVPPTYISDYHFAAYVPMDMVIGPHQTRTQVTYVNQCHFKRFFILSYII